MDRAYASRYRDLYNRHWWWRARERIILRFLRRLRPSGGWHRILDVGCGGGVFFDRLSEFGAVEGVEPDRLLVDATSPWRSHIHVGPFDETYQPTHKFGLILMLDVVEHLDRPVEALRQGIGLLAPDGIMLITVPAFEWLWTSHDDFNQHRVRYTKATLRETANRSGFQIEHMEYFFHWTVPGKMVQRAMETVGSGDPAPPNIPPRPINAALYQLSRVEYAVLRHLRLPFGTSLLAYGRPAPGRAT